MFHVYLLKSIKDGNLYIGYTNNLRNRLKEHNSGKVASTKSRIPLKLVYFESYLSKDDAIIREQNLKLRGRARRHLLLRIKNTLAS